MALPLSLALLLAALVLLLGGIYYATARKDGVSFREAVFNWPMVSTAWGVGSCSSLGSLRPLCSPNPFAQRGSRAVTRYPGIMRRVATPGVGPIGKEPRIVHVLGNVGIEQLERFVGVFSTAGAEARRRHGSRGAQLFRVAGEEGRVVVLFEWESEKAFEAFRNDPSFKETMRSSGTVGPPEFTFLEKVGEFPS